MAKVTQEKKVVPLELLKEFPDNPNQHPIAQVEALAKSMEAYGQYYPIVVDENYMILAGHGKKLALEHLGRKEADVTILKGLTEKQKKKLVVEDNKIQSMSFINYEKVENLIKEIGEIDIIGYPEDYLDSIVNELKVDNMGVDFDTPAQKKPIESIPQEEIDEDTEELHEFESGMQTVRTMRCPHCGEEITL